MKRYYTIIGIGVAILFCLVTVSFAAGYDRFFGNDSSTTMPAGWNKGEKKGWDGKKLPPGLLKKAPKPTNPNEPISKPIDSEEPFSIVVKKPLDPQLESMLSHFKALSPGMGMFMSNEWKMIKNKDGSGFIYGPGLVVTIGKDGEIQTIAETVGRITVMFYPDPNVVKNVSPPKGYHYQ
jgi:hypothetical protein